MNGSHIDPTGVTHLYPIPLVDFSACLVGQPTPRLEVSFTNNGSTKK
jgi:hypothetical protein